MTLAFSDPYKNATLIGGGCAALMNGGKLKVYTSGLATLIAEYTLANPAFAIGAAGIASLQGAPLTDDALANGTMADFTLEASDTTVHVTGTNEVTLSGGGGALIYTGASLAVTLGETINFNAYTISFS